MSTTTKNTATASTKIFNAATLASFKRSHVSTMPAKRESKGLTRGELAHYAPSVFSDCPDREVSEKYVQFGSLEVFDALTQDGEFAPVKAFEDRKSATDKGTHKHVVVYQRANYIADKAQRVVVTNSHDRSSYWRIRQGNESELTGETIVTDKFIKIRHMGHGMDEVLDAVREMATSEFSLESVIARMRAVKLNDAEAAAFAHAAALLRFKGKFEVRNARALLTRRHKNMNSNDLWTIYNAVHENLTLGGVCVGERALKRIYNVAAWERLNENLWKLGMAALKELENMRGVAVEA